MQSVIDPLAVGTDLLVLVVQLLQEMKIVQDGFVSAFGQCFADTADDAGNGQSADILHQDADGVGLSDAEGLGQRIGLVVYLAMACSTRSVVSGDSFFDPLITWDTVAVDTPARSATSRMVAIFSLIFKKVKRFNLLYWRTRNLSSERLRN